MQKQGIKMLFIKGMFEGPVRSFIMYLNTVRGGAALSDINESKDLSFLRGCGNKMAHPLSSSNVFPGAKGRKSANEQFISL